MFSLRNLKKIIFELSLYPFLSGALPKTAKYEKFRVLFFNSRLSNGLSIF